MKRFASCSSVKDHFNNTDEQSTVHLSTIPSIMARFPPKERDYCASDLQQIGRLVAHHSAITQAFIYLHMQACMKNVLNSQEQMQKTGSSHI